MAGSRRRRQLKRQQARDLPPAKRPTEVVRVNFVDLLSEDLLANIRHRLGSLDRLSFGVVCKTAGHPMNLDTAATPWIVFPGTSEEKVTFFPLADRRAATARTSVLGTRGHVVLGSSFGWLATADELGALQIVDPVTGERARLPDVSTFPFIRYSRSSSRVGHYYINTAAYLQFRYGGKPPPEGKEKDIMPRSNSHNGNQMRQWFYAKVVLAASPRPDNYAAMLILDKDFGVPAFATAQDRAWKVAPSRDGVEDAIHHDGRFYSVSHDGAVEAWECHGVTGEFTSKLVSVVSILDVENFVLERKYIVAMPDGRLVVVTKYTREEASTGYYDTKKWSCVFIVQVLDAKRGRWKNTTDIGDTALFVGMNSSLCVSTKVHPGIKPGCVYFTDDELHQAAERRDREAASGYHRHDTDKADHGPQHVGVYNLKDGTVEVVEGFGLQPWSSPPVWFTPSV
ncbi:hypothetical protein EJB05_47110, partial [Eragrostis curvula]